MTFNIEKYKHNEKLVNSALELVIEDLEDESPYEYTVDMSYKFVNAFGNEKLAFIAAHMLVKLALEIKKSKYSLQNLNDIDLRVLDIALAEMKDLPDPSMRTEFYIESLNKLHDRVLEIKRGD